MKLKKHYKRMNIKYNQEDGFNLDIPYSRWLVFCIGLSMVLKVLPDFITQIRWW